MKICILSPRFPFPENGGDVLRINSIARYLKENGHELILISFCFGEIKLQKEYFELYDTIYIVKKHKISSYIFSLLFALCGKPLQCGYYYSLAFLNQLKKTIKSENSELYISHLLRMVPYLEKEKLENDSIIEMTDALSKTYTLSSKSKNKSIKKIIYNFEHGLIKKYEKKVIENFKKIVLVSQNDIEYLKNSTNLSCNNLFFYTNGVSILEKLPETYNKNKICFVGNMRTLQNQDAVLFFVNKVFPLIKEKNPNAVFYIVGAEPSENIKKLHDGKSIIVTGFVENLEDTIKDSCVAVASVQIAAGIQNKVLVAMGCGIPVVLSSLIAKAIPELKDEENCYIKDDIKKITQSVLNLMNNSELRNKIAINGYNMVKENYSWNKKLSGYDELKNIEIIVRGGYNSIVTSNK